MEYEKKKRVNLSRPPTEDILRLVVMLREPKDLAQPYDHQPEPRSFAFAQDDKTPSRFSLLT